MPQLIFHGEELDERFPFSRIPEGEHVVSGEVLGDSGDGRYFFRLAPHAEGGDDVPRGGEN